MLGRVGAFLLLVTLAIPYAPIPVTEDAEGGAFDAMVRVYEYNGISRQERPLVLTPAEIHDRFYFVMEAEEPVRPPTLPVGDPPDEGDGAAAVALVQVRIFGGSEVICDGQVFEISSGQKHQVCDGLKAETHYVFIYTNTLPGEIQMWGRNL